MISNRVHPREATQSLFTQRYPAADCLLLAGSIVRGEATATSDLDIVVLYADLPHAYRESLVWEGYPVEAFVHSPQTLRYFFVKMDGPSGFPLLMQMVCEAIEVPSATPLSAEAKRAAHVSLLGGPPPLTPHENEQRRYALSDLIDDIRAPRSPQELTAAGAQLYGALADFHFRSRNLWSARGKSIPRKLHQYSPEFAPRFLAAFEALFGAGDPRPVVAIAEEILKPSGGMLFEGYRLDAPPEFRLP